MKANQPYENREMKEKRNNQSMKAKEKAKIS
jgi:hypothetical protein